MTRHPVLRLLVHVVVTIAYVSMVVWFVWSFAGEDSIPTAVDVASAIAAGIIVIDVGLRLFGQRRERDRSS